MSFNVGDYVTGSRFDAETFRDEIERENRYLRGPALDEGYRKLNQQVEKVVPPKGYVKCSLSINNVKYLKDHKINVIPDVLTQDFTYKAYSIYFNGDEYNKFDYQEETDTQIIDHYKHIEEYKCECGDLSTKRETLKYDLYYVKKEIGEKSYQNNVDILTELEQTYWAHKEARQITKKHLSLNLFAFLMSFLSILGCLGAFLFFTSVAKEDSYPIPTFVTYPLMALAIPAIVFGIVCVISSSKFVKKIEPFHTINGSAKLMVGYSFLFMAFEVVGLGAILLMLYVSDDLAVLSLISLIVLIILTIVFLRKWSKNFKEIKNAYNKFVESSALLKDFGGIKGYEDAFYIVAKGIYLKSK